MILDRRLPQTVTLDPRSSKLAKGNSYELPVPRPPDPGQVKSDQGARRYSLKRKGKRYANAQTKSTLRAGRTPPGSPRPGRRATTGAEHTRTLCPRAVPAAGSCPGHRGRHHAAFSGDGGGI